MIVNGQELPPLMQEFVTVMMEIWQYGFEKHGENSFQAHALRGDSNRWFERVESEQLALHSREHFSMYLAGELHDHFGTLEHQLGASAFNVMIEFYFLKALQKEKSNGF